MVTVSSQFSSSLQEPSEGAIRALLEGEERSVVFDRVWRPFGIHRYVFFHPLMSEVKLLVTPVGCSQLGIGDDLSDLLLSAAKLLRSISREHIVQDCANFN